MTANSPSADLALGPELTIPFAADCRNTLVEALATTAGDLRLDLSGVTDVDSAGLQLLLLGAQAEGDGHRGISSSGWAKAGRRCSGVARRSTKPCWRRLALLSYLAGKPKEMDGS